MHIRCITNKYNIQVVIDACEDRDFVRTTSNLDWIDIDGTAKPGDFYYQNRIISLDSDDYKIIESVIDKFEKELLAAEKAKAEQEAAERDARVAAEIAALEAEAEAEAERQKATAPVPVIAKPADLTQLRKEALSHPIPQQIDYFNDPQPESFSQEDADMWDHRAVEIDRLISAVERGTWEDHAIFFNPPHRIAPDTQFESIREFDVVPHETKEDYLSYLRANSVNIKKYRDYVKTQVTK